MDECALGTEISEKRDRCAVSLCWRIEPARLAVKVVWHGLPAAAPDVLDALYMALEPVAVGLDPKSQSATLCDPLADRGIVVKRLGPEDVAVAHGNFLDLLATGGLKHFNQPELTAAARGAQGRALAGAQALERRVPTNQAPLTSAEFSVWAFQRWEEVSQPGVYAL